MLLRARLQYNEDGCQAEDELDADEDRIIRIELIGHRFIAASGQEVHQAVNDPVDGEPDPDSSRDRGNEDKGVTVGPLTHFVGG